MHANAESRLVYSHIKRIAADPAEIFCPRKYKRNTDADIEIPLNLNEYKNSFLKYIKTNGLNILNLHLPSGGPISNNKQITEASVQASIKRFVDENLPIFEIDNMPEVIIGDTNITVSKCWGPYTVEESSHPNHVEIHKARRKNILKWVKSSIDNRCNLDGYHWVIIMSPIKIKKIRSGGLLNNNQMYKSNIENNEEDGTLIAVRCPRSNELTADKLSGLKLGHHYQVCFGNDDANYISSEDFEPLESTNGKAELVEQSSQATNGKSESDKQTVDFLTFDTEPDRCLNTETQLLQDRLFIDHAVVQISFESIKLLQGNSVTPSNVESQGIPWKNLVALNLGSIINSGKKNWKIELMDPEKTATINQIDKELFIGMKNALETLEENKGKNIEYQDVGTHEFVFNGQQFGKLVMSNELPFLTEFARVLEKADLSLKETIFANPVRGGGYKTNKKKYKRKPKTHKLIHKLIHKFK